MLRILLLKSVVKNWREKKYEAVTYDFQTWSDYKIVLMFRFYNNVDFIYLIIRHQKLNELNKIENVGRREEKKVFKKDNTKNSNNKSKKKWKQQQGDK